MSGHTPGPWVSSGTAVEHPLHRTADICNCSIDSLWQDHLYRSYDEECANARLIAAAPDLLAVCQRIANINVFSVDNDVAQIVMQARTVFEMATGAKA